MFIELSEIVCGIGHHIRYQYVCVETPDAGMGHSKDPVARKEKIAGHNEAAWQKYQDQDEGLIPPTQSVYQKHQVCFLTLSWSRTVT